MYNMVSSQSGEAAAGIDTEKQGFLENSTDSLG